MTDASGTHYLKLDFEQEGEPQPVSVRAEATVMDVNRQAWAAATTLLVHPADLYVGLRCDRTFVERGQPLKIDIIVTDLDGVPVADRPVQVQAARLEWRTVRGAWQQEAVDVQECTVGSGSEPVSCTFKTDDGRRVPDHGHRHRRLRPPEPEPVHPLGERRPAAGRAQGGAGRRSP